LYSGVILVRLGYYQYRLVLVVWGYNNSLGYCTSVSNRRSSVCTSWHGEQSSGGGGEARACFCVLL